VAHHLSRDSSRNRGLFAARINKDDRARLRMTLLPVQSRKLHEGSVDAIVERSTGSLNPIVFASTRGAFQSGPSGQVEQDGQVWNQTSGREGVGSKNVLCLKSASGYLVRVGRKEEPVCQDELSPEQRRSHDIGHELGARRHEQQRFRSLVEAAARIEQQSADFVTRRRPSRLTHRVRHESLALEERVQVLKLGRLPDSLDSFQDNQAAGHQINPA